MKALLCDADGRTLATASHPCRMSHPRSGWSEQEPAEWRTAIAATVRHVLVDAGLHAADVTHLALACQVDGVVPVNASFSPQRVAIIWLDRRATAQASRLVDNLGGDRIFDVTGLNCDASHTLPKMMWIRDEEPDVYRASASLPPVAGYLVGWLTGVAFQDHANASSSLAYDVRRRIWSELLIEAAGLDARKLTPLRPAHDVVAPLRSEAAEALGLTQRCLVVTGTGDDHGASLGAGVVSPGPIADVTGTAEPVAAASPKPLFDREHVVETHAHAVDGSFLVENPGFVSGGSTLWLGETFGAAEQAEVFSWAERAAPGADGVLFIPALSGATAPRWNDRMRGAFSGLAMNHGREHLARAVLEGCAYALRDIVGRLRALGLGGDEIRVVGGGGRNELWMQIKADVTGAVVRRVLSEEATATGAAMLALVAAGTFKDAAAAAETVRLAERAHTPTAANAGVYEDAYRRYRRLFDSLEAAV